jgi:hypothetical protein
MSNDSQNGWNEYSKLVLKELQTLSNDIDHLSGQIGDLKKELIEMKSREDRVDQLIKWKEKVDEVATPTQLKDTAKQLEDLKKFKIQSVTLFAVIQFLMGGLIAALEFFNSK